MRWLRTIFPVRSAADCLFALKTLRREFEGEIAWKAVEGAVSRLIRNSQISVRSAIVNDGMTPRAIVLNAITNICFDEASSGWHHVYRGRLSMMGLSYKSILYKNVDAQLRNGLVSEDEKRELIGNFERAVKEVG